MESEVTVKYILQTTSRIKIDESIIKSQEKNKEEIKKYKALMYLEQNHDLIKDLDKK